MTRTTAPRPLARGVSLVEALVAFAVLAFGMLGVAGMQATLRFNADIAKQRSEAVRIAQETLEDWRAFSVLNVTAGHTATYSAIADLPQTDITGYTTNTTYRRTGTVKTSAPMGHKALVVDVEWADRNGAVQSVRLASLVAGVAPELAATLVSPTGGLPTRNPYARHRGIPPQARDFGNGTSGYLPPQSDGTGVAWLFSNSTGLFRSCSTAIRNNALLTAADLSCDNSQYFMLLSGYIRYATRSTQPDATAVDDQHAAGPDFPTPTVQVRYTLPTTGTRSCYVSSLGSGSYREYQCGVPITQATPTWSGSVQFGGLSIASGTSDDDEDHYRICRYYQTAPYANVKDALTNQNYVIIRAGREHTSFTCPAGVTWPHQPAS